MSKTSYVLIAVMAAALLFMGAVRGRQWYEERQDRAEQERLEREGAFSFQHVPISLAPKVAPQSYGFKEYKMPSDILIGKPLSSQAQVRQAQDTIVSIVEDYQQEPSVQSFNRDLSQASGEKAADLTALSSGDLTELIQTNPQIRSVVDKHMRNPDFAKIIEQIFSNPQYQRSVRILERQTKSAPAAKKTP